MEKTRISKLLAERGLCSRREADAYIERGWVRVDGKVATLGEKAYPDQSITLDKSPRWAKKRIPTSPSRWTSQLRRGRLPGSPLS